MDFHKIKRVIAAQASDLFYVSTHNINNINQPKQFLSLFLQCFYDIFDFYLCIYNFYLYLCSQNT